MNLRDRLRAPDDTLKYTGTPRWKVLKVSNATVSVDVVERRGALLVVMSVCVIDVESNNPVTTFVVSERLDSVGSEDRAEILRLINNAPVECTTPAKF